VPIARRLSRHRAAAALLLALALLLKAAIPAGWMPVFADGTVRLRPCTGLAQLPAPQPPASPTGHKHHERHHQAHAGGERAQALHAGNQSLGVGAGEDHGAGHGDGNAQPCTYAAIGFAWTPPPATALAEPAPTPAALRAHLAPWATPGQGLAAPPPPATGPPSPIGNPTLRRLGG
jgi:hypothetical protein